MAKGEGKILERLPTKIQAKARDFIASVLPSTWFGPLQPLKPFAPQTVAGRQRDYQIGENMVIRTRETGRPSFALLRAFAENCDILRLVIETRKDQVEALDWEIVPADPESADDTKDDAKIKEITAFFKRPDKRHDWGTWLKAILEDMFVVDAATLYKRRDRVGRLYSLDLMDGTLIKVLNDGSGRIPEYPDPAYQQILHGMTAIDYTTDEILYAPRTLRTWSVYGLSVVEQILLTIETLLNRTKFNANYYTDANTPAGFLFMDSELTTEQVEAYGKFLDASLSGNLQDRRKILPAPGARGKWQEVKEPPFKNEYDEWLARIVCFAFSISPQAFVKQMNRATAQTAQETAIEEGLAPIIRWIENWMNRLIEDEFETTDYRFSFEKREEMDPEVASKIRASDVNAGIITRDEAREDLGKDPVGGAANELGVVTMQGFIPLEMGVEQAQATHEANIEAIKNPKPVAGAAAAPGKKPPPAKGAKAGKAEKLAKAGGSKKNSTPIPLTRPAAAKARAVVARKVKDVLHHTAVSVAHQIRNSALLKADEDPGDTVDRVVRELDLSNLDDLSGISDDLRSVAADAAGLTVREVGIDQSTLFNQINTRAIDFARDRAAEMVSDITEATENKLRALISDGMLLGQNRDQIADVIMSTDPEVFSEDRALLIADTEVGIANGQGALAGLEEAQKAGVEVKKEWLLGENPCEECQKNADQGPIDIDQDFQSGDATTPAHPRCECTTIGVVPEDINNEGT